MAESRMWQELLEPLKMWMLDWQYMLAILLVAYLLHEQISYYWKRRLLPGPLFLVPIIGSAVPMFGNPSAFWDEQAKYAEKHGMSGNSLLGKFVVFVRNSDISHKVFANVRPKAFTLVGHPLGKKLFGENNLIFMRGDEHKFLRGKLAPMFTSKALSLYITLQEGIMRKFVAKWLQVGEKPMAMRDFVRDLNLETSQTVFAGPYLSVEVRRALTDDYQLFNQGLLAVPLYFPGSAFWKATRAVQRIVKAMAECAAQSRARMREGAEPSCLLDFWMKEVVREDAEAQAAGLPPPSHTSNMEAGQHMFDFLFAAQDASTSSLLWCLTLLESHPAVVHRLREEQQRVRPDRDLPFTLDVLRELKYTEMTMKEILRFRPPATLVPHVAEDDVPLTDTYTVPKGTIIFPSLFESSFQGFTDPYTFDPERFSAERREDQAFKKNWLLFGAGPHCCLGQRYAMNHLMLFISILASHVEWERVRSPGCDELAYGPTIYPADGAVCIARPLTVVS